MSFTKDLILSFEAHSNPEYAVRMKAYLRNKFELYGIKTKLRRELLKEAVKINKADVQSSIRAISIELFTSNYR